VHSCGKKGPGPILRYAGIRLNKAVQGRTEVSGNNDDDDDDTVITING
jgi:hypothetical protein